MAKKNLQWLLDNIDVPNLVDSLDEDTVKKVAARVKAGYDLDENSRVDWYRRTEEGLKIAKQITETKTFPWKGAANVKYPLIVISSIQFAARCYPQIVKSPDVVKVAVIGEDTSGQKQSQAKRVSQHMSFQFLEQMTEWESDLDQLLHGLPVMGTYFKKTYFDSLLARNKSISLTPFELVVNLKHKGGIDTCRRISHRIMLYKNEVLERENKGLFTGGVSEKFDYTDGCEDEQELFIEQHCWYDLDGDGYEEPYIITIHYESESIARIVANYDESTLETNGNKVVRITPIQYFTKFSFIPSPDGEFYDLGFAHLLGPINESISTTINLLLDAGALSNTGGGFISKGLRWKGGHLSFSLGEWKPVDCTGMSLKDSIMPLPIKEPSNVLFQLLGLLIETGNKMASVNDAMMGETPSQNTPATTTLALIEQGLKVFSGIYKRIYRALKEEFKKAYRLNSLYLDEVEYFNIIDSQEQAAVFKNDYQVNNFNVVPVADPTMASEAQRLAQSNALMQTLEANPTPEGKIEILRQYYESISAKNIDKLLPRDKIEAMLNNPAPSPDVLKFQLETQKAKDDMDIKLRDAEIRTRQAEANLERANAEIDLLRAQTLKTIADAEAVEPGAQLEQYKAIASDLAAERQHEREVAKLNQAADGGANGRSNNKGTDASVASPPNNKAGVQGIKQPAAKAAGQPPVGESIESQLSGADGTADYTGLGQDIRNQFNSGT
jgi:chaperonin GroES